MASRERLLDVGFEAPSQRGAQPRQNELEDAELGALRKLEDCCVSGALRLGLSLASRALFRSQGGPMARFDPQLFRVLLLRRLWLPLPPTDRYCLCGLPLDPRGHHRAACATAGGWDEGVLVWKSAAARVYWEAGASRVSLNARVQDMDLAQPDVLDNRRLENIADGWPLFLGAQLARRVEELESDRKKGRDSRWMTGSSSENEEGGGKWI